MLKDNLTIKRVFLAQPTGKSNCSYGCSQGKFESKINTEFRVVGEITAIVVPEYQEVIDIETHDVYPMFERDEKGRIKGLSISDLNEQKVIALYFLDKEIDKMSLLYQIDLKSRAKKIYRNYLDTKEHKEKSRVLLKKKRK